MGVASGCGCKEVYRFPHTTYPYSSCICSFLQQHPYFCSFKKKFFRSCSSTFCNFVMIFSRSINTYGRLQASHGSRMKGCTYCFIHEEAHTNKRFISCGDHQLYSFKGRGVDLEVEGVRYIEMHCGPHTCIRAGPASFKERRSRTRVIPLKHYKCMPTPYICVILTSTVNCCIVFNKKMNKK